ncbi:nuclease-related domain-containing protein [Pseudoneobacillus sp. C159]
MIIKPRFESLELIIYRILNQRLRLTPEQKNYYHNLEKGFDGEKNFDLFLEQNLKMDCHILNDLLLESNNNHFQIDSALHSGETIHVFDVKNSEGDYFVDGDIWRAYPSKIEVKNPFLQLNRCESLLRRLLQDHGLNYKLKAYIVFINPQFALFQAPLNFPYILPSQLWRFVNKLNNSGTVIRPHNVHLSEKLMSLNIKESPYSKLPKYDYAQLKKLILCPKCHSVMCEISNKLMCQCGSVETVVSGVLRSVNELILLFPNMKITTKLIYEWCGVIQSTKTIQKILDRNFEKKGHGMHTYYVKK